MSAEGHEGHGVRRLAEQFEIDPATDLKDTDKKVVEIEKTASRASSCTTNKDY